MNNKISTLCGYLTIALLSFLLGMIFTRHIMYQEVNDLKIKYKSIMQDYYSATEDVLNQLDNQYYWSDSFDFQEYEKAKKNIYNTINY